MRLRFLDTVPLCGCYCCCRCSTNRRPHSRLGPSNALRGCNLMPANVVVSGAARGIGLELVRLYLNGGARVWALCRSASDGLLKLAGQFGQARLQIVPGIDVRTCCDIRLEDCPSIDILINNAGILREGDRDFMTMNLDAILEQIDVNALGWVRVTRALLPIVSPRGKIMNITSRMGSIADNTSGGYYGYRASKAAMNALTVSLALELKPKGICVGLLHPGYVQTDMTGGQGFVSAAESASMLAKRIDEYSISSAGTFMHANGEELPW